MRRFWLSAVQRMAASVALLSTSLVQPAQATLLEFDSSFGSKTITRDTDTGLDWLDLPVSIGTIAEVDARLAPGGDLYGWRRATTTEVLTFWQNAGVVPTGEGDEFSGTYEPAEVAAIVALIELVGYTDTAPLDEFSWGYTAESPAPGEWYAAWLWRRWDHDCCGYTRGAATIWTRVSPNPTSQQYGSWLVRDYYSVPEPAAFLLIGLGAVGTGLSRRRKIRI